MMETRTGLALERAATRGEDRGPMTAALSPKRETTLLPSPGRQCAPPLGRFGSAGAAGSRDEWRPWAGFVSPVRKAEQRSLARASG